MILWGTYRLNVTSNSCPPAEENIAEIKVISQPALAQILEEHQILINEDIVQLRHFPILEDSEIVSGPNGTPKYNKDTDYALDYSTGQIHRIASGSMANVEDCYITYTYYGNTTSSILLGTGRDRMKVSLECWSNYADFAMLQSDYRNRAKKKLTLSDGTSFDAIIFKIPNTVEVQGIPRKTFSITFIEA